MGHEALRSLGDIPPFDSGGKEQRGGGGGDPGMERGRVFLRARWGSRALAVGRGWVLPLLPSPGSGSFSSTSGRPLPCGHGESILGKMHL